jgi:hypothetical protein
MARLLVLSLSALGAPLLLAQAGCDDAVVVRETRDEQRPTAAPTAVTAVSAGAAPSAAPSSRDARGACVTALDLGRGTIALPAGLCARRVGEGDDLSTEVVDLENRVRARVTRIAHGAPVGDACGDDVVSVEERTIRGHRARVCTRTGGRRCYAFPSVANLCSATASDVALVDDLVALL